MTATTQSHTFREVLAIPGVRRLWLGQLVSIAGDFLAIFAVISIVSFRMQGSPAQITGVTISYMLPLALFGPLAGVFVDRWNPRTTMIVSDLARAVLVLLLVFARNLPEIYAILFALSTVSTFFIPAQSVLVRTLVPREALLTANTLVQQATLMIRMVSPALAGALVARFGPDSCFALDTVSFFFSAIMLRGVFVTCPRTPQPTGRTRTVLSDLSAGIRFILGHPTIAFVMVAMASATFAISCFSPLIAAFVRDILREDVRSYGAIGAMIGLGMIIGTQAVRLATARSTDFSLSRPCVTAFRLSSSPNPPKPRHSLLVGARTTSSSLFRRLVGQPFQAADRIHPVLATSSPVPLSLPRRQAGQPAATPSPNPPNPRYIVLFSLVIIAAGISLMAASTAAAITGLGALVMGAGVGILMVPAQTLIQRETPLPMVGRVGSGVVSLISVAQILGLILSGTFAAAIGLRPLFLLSAALLAILALAGCYKIHHEKNPLTELNTAN